MKKYRLFYDPEKMENFINNMSAKGYGLTKISGYVYEFTKIQPDQYKYKIDFLNGKSETEINNYISFVTESGIYFIARYGKMVVFAKETDFQLYTDVESKIKAYTRTKNHFLITVLTSVLCLSSCIINAVSCYNNGLFILLCLQISLSLLWIIIGSVLTSKFVRYINKIKMLKKNK